MGNYQKLLIVHRTYGIYSKEKHAFFPIGFPDLVTGEMVVSLSAFFVEFKKLST